MKGKPILRWAGGKQWLINQIDQYIPDYIENYYEPFAGGLSVLIHLLNNAKINNDSFISDSNEKLINFYVQLQNNPNRLIGNLKKYRNEEEEYYTERNFIRRSLNTKAAQFLYLNRTSFNGIYRENLKGKYNVPYGHKTYKTLFDSEQIKNLSDLFSSVFFNTSDFEQIEENIQIGDFIFFDPPYTVAHEHNGFIKYNQKIFTWEDQIRLKELVQRLSQRNINFIVTNAHHQSILDLYHDVGNINLIQRSSTVGGTKARRGNFNEVLISNI